MAARRPKDDPVALLWLSILLLGVFILMGVWIFNKIELNQSADKRSAPYLRSAVWIPPEGCTQIVGEPSRYTSTCGIPENCINTWGGLKPYHLSTPYRASRWCRINNDAAEMTCGHECTVGKWVRNVFGHP